VTELQARLVDPRDARWESDDPRFRVLFWTRFGNGWSSCEFEIENADVAEVLDWVEKNRGDATAFTMYVVVDRGSDRGLIRLAGTDPTDT
jgi:hypothetical protein